MKTKQQTKETKLNSIDIRLLVIMTVEVHLFPFRTQKLSQFVLMVVHLVDV